MGLRSGCPPHRCVEEGLKVIREIFSNGHTWALELKATGEPAGCFGNCIFGESNISIAENLFRKMAENGNKSFKMTSLFRKNGIFRNKYHYSFEKGSVLRDLAHALLSW